jgi:hypothetical protein
MSIVAAGKRVGKTFCELSYTVTGLGEAETHDIFCREMKGRYAKRLTITLTSAPSAAFDCSLYKKAKGAKADIFTLTGLSNSETTDQDIGNAEGDYTVITEPLRMSINTSLASVVVVTLVFTD